MCLDIKYCRSNNLKMKESTENIIAALQLELEEAIRMLRLVSANKRTCLEVEDWLNINYPLDENNEDDVFTIDDLIQK